MSAAAGPSSSSSGRPQRNASRNIQAVYRDEWADDEEEAEEDRDEDDREDMRSVADANGNPDVSETGPSLSRDNQPRHRQVAALSGVSAANKAKSRGKPFTNKAPTAKFHPTKRETVDGAHSSSQPETGMMADAPDTVQAQQVYAFVLQKLQSHQWKGRRAAESLESIPTDPAFRAKAQHFLSLNDVFERARQSQYSSAESFESDMIQMFNCFRRGYDIGAQQHGDVMILQRLYQCMTAAHPLVRHTTLETIKQNLNRGNPSQHYSSVAYGPGTAVRGGDNDLPTRMALKGKQYYNYTYHKGQLLTVGDWVHLMNPVDPTRPIVAQIWKIFKREGVEDEPASLSACWYFRPEQTVHPASRMFFPDEVMKTGVYIDHMVEDVLNKCFTLFYTRWTKGRPPRHIWNPLDPLYIAEYRYDERTYDSNKIKNWNSCLPEELRANEQPIELFPEPISLPTRVISPLLRGITGPGRICDESEIGLAGNKKALAAGANSAKRGPDAAEELPDPFGSPSKKKSRRPDSSVDPEVSLVSGWTSSHMPIPTPQQVEAAHHILRTYSTLIPARIGQAEYGRLYHALGSSQGLTLDFNSVIHHLRGALDIQTLTTWREALQIGVAAQSFGIGTKGQSTSSAPARLPLSATVPALPPGGMPVGSRPAVASVERSLAAAVGGLEAYVAPLSEQAKELFASDIPQEEEEEEAEPMEDDSRISTVKAVPTRKGIQWFAAPPVDLPRSVRGTGHNGLTHSLDYLYHLALRSSKGASDAKHSEDVQKGLQEETSALAQLVQSWKDVMKYLPNGGVEASEEEKVRELEEEVSQITGTAEGRETDRDVLLRRQAVKLVTGLE